MKSGWNELSRMNEVAERQLLVQYLKSYLHFSNDKKIPTDIIASLNKYVQNLKCYIGNSVYSGEFVILTVLEGYINFDKNDFEVVLKVGCRLRPDKGDIIENIMHINMTKDAFAAALLHDNVELVLHHKDSTYIDVKHCGEIVLDSV